MAKTDDLKLCEEYLINYIEDIKKQLNSLERKLIEQVDLCPITWSSIEQIDHNLKEFVDCQRKYLLARNTHRLEKFKENIQNNQSFEVISAYYPTINQVDIKNNKWFYLYIYIYIFDIFRMNSFIN